MNLVTHRRILVLPIALALAGCNIRPTTGRTTQATTAAPAPTASTVAKLSVDADRDGAITAADDANRDTWTQARGAIFAFNNDADSGKKGVDSADTIVNGLVDTRSMGRIVAPKYAGPTLTSATLAFAPTSAPVRVFKKAQSGATFTELLKPGTTSAALTVSELTAADTEFFIEALGPRTASFDGNVTVTIDFKGGTPTKDTVALRVSPIIYVDNTRPAVKLFVMNITNAGGSPNQPFYNALKTGLAAQNVAMQDVDQSLYGFDRWVQDCMQLGYNSFVGANGKLDFINDFNQLERGAAAQASKSVSKPTGELASLVPKELISPNNGMTYVGPSQSQDSCNFGGNIEVLPPYAGFKYGRLVHGGGNVGTVTGQADNRHVNPEQVAYMNAQVQGPTLEISSEWLLVGHVDEFMMAIPDKSAGASQPWKLTWASPTVARAALLALQQAGRGSEKVFTGRQTETTVDAILADAQLLAFNDQCQQRLDSNKQALIAAGVPASAFVDVPVLFEISQSGGQNYALALNPGVANCVPINDTLYVPDPEGPKDANGKDVWREAVLAGVTPLGLKVTFVDVFTSYHELAGEAHCGTNVIYQAYDTPWWK